MNRRNPDPNLHLADWSKPLLTTCGVTGSATTDMIEAGCYACLRIVLHEYGFIESDDGTTWAHPGEQTRPPMSITSLPNGKYRFVVEYPGRPWTGDFGTFAAVVEDAGGM